MRSCRIPAWGRQGISVAVCTTSSCCRESPPCGSAGDQQRRRRCRDEPSCCGVIAASGLPWSCPGQLQPFAVRYPLTPVAIFGERAAVAVSWLDGAALPDGVGDPTRIGELLTAVREVAITPESTALLEVAITPEFTAVLDAPRTYTGGHHWADIMAEEVIPRLPARWREEGLRRLDDALALEPVPDRPVHGDLGGVPVVLAEKTTDIADLR